MWQMLREKQFCPATIQKEKKTELKLGGQTPQNKVLESCEIQMIKNCITYFYLWWSGHMTFKLLSKYNLKILIFSYLL